MSDGKQLTDNKDFTIDIKECNTLQQVVGGMSPIILNEVTNNKELAKELFHFFSIKIFNALFLPII